MDKDLDIVIKGENVKEFLGIYSLTEYYQSRKEQIPSVLIVRLFEILNNKTQLRRNELLEEAQKSSLLALNRFNLLKLDEISWKERKVPNSATFFTPDSRWVFTELIYAFKLYIEDNPKAYDKDEAIHFYYWAIQDFYREDMKEESANKLMRFNTAVITGILAMATGFQLSTKRNDKLSKEDIFQSTRNAIKKDFEAKRKKPERKNISPLKKGT